MTGQLPNSACFQMFSMCTETTVYDCRCVQANTPTPTFIVRNSREEEIMTIISYHFSSQVRPQRSDRTSLPVHPLVLSDTTSSSATIRRNRYQSLAISSTGLLKNSTYVAASNWWTRSRIQALPAREQSESLRPPHP